MWYISDNGSAFSSKSYAAHLSNFSQIQQFAGVGAHHHNGVAEKAIQTSMSIATTMMHHPDIHWPEVSDPSLWPLVVQYATYLYKVPDPSHAFAQMISSPRHDGRNESSITFMFGDVHFTFMTRQFLMERNSHIGNQELLQNCSWVYAQIMQVLVH